MPSLTPCPGQVSQAGVVYLWRELTADSRGSPHAGLALSASQGRQKLARFNAREFATLIIDILSEAKRRQQGKSLSSPTGGKGKGGGARGGPCPRISTCIAPFWGWHDRWVVWLSPE